MCEATVSSGVSPYSYSWRVENSPYLYSSGETRLSGTAPSPNAQRRFDPTFQNPGYYVVVLTVTDSAGWQKTTSASVDVLFDERVAQASAWPELDASCDPDTAYLGWRDEGNEKLLPPVAPPP